MRCFPVVDLPDSLTAGITVVQDRLSDADGLRFTDPESTHVILKFLDEVSPDHVGAVEDAVESTVEAAGVGPFNASVGGLGIFPLLDYIRVVRVGVDDGTAELTRLHEAVERETTALGFNPKNHEFTPRVTLVRIDDACEKVLVRRVIGGESSMVGSFHVHEVRLRKSDLGPGSSEYETTARVSL